MIDLHYHINGFVQSNLPSACHTTRTLSIVAASVSAFILAILCASILKL